MTAAPDRFLALEGLTKDFGSTRAVDGISLTVWGIGEERSEKYGSALLEITRGDHP